MGHLEDVTPLRGHVLYSRNALRGGRAPPLPPLSPPRFEQNALRGMRVAVPFVMFVLVLVVAVLLVVVAAVWVVRRWL